MKIEYTSGCMAHSLTIDGVETIDLDPKEFNGRIRINSAL